MASEMNHRNVQRRIVLLFGDGSVSNSRYWRIITRSRRRMYEEKVEEEFEGLLNNKKQARISCGGFVLTGGGKGYQKMFSSRIISWEFSIFFF